MDHLSLRSSKHEFKSHTFRETRAKLQANFAKPGNPGSKFRNQMEKIIKCMTLPKAARDELGIGDDGIMPELAKTPTTKQT